MNVASEQPSEVLSLLSGVENTFFSKSDPHTLDYPENCGRQKK